METDKLSDLEDETTGKQAKPDTSPDLDRSSDIKGNYDHCKCINNLLNTCVKSSNKFERQSPW